MAQELGRGDDDLVFGTGEDKGELGMAEESVLRSLPAHRLRALEKQQTDATLSNQATRARAPPGVPGGLAAYQHNCTTPMRTRHDMSHALLAPVVLLRVLQAPMQVCKSNKRAF